MTTLTPVSARNAARLCSNCGKATPLKMKKGRCRACYEYHRRTGKERPPWYGTSARASSDNDILAFHDRYMKGEPVATLAEEAGVKPVTVYNWFRGLGLSLKITPPAKRTCSNCGRVVQGLRHGRCNSCYQWHRTHNEERPLKEDVREPLRRSRLAPDDVVLKLHDRYMNGEGITALATEAGIGRVTLWRRFADLGLPKRGYDVPRPCSNCGRVVQGLRHGRCNPCYQWWRRHNEERPLVREGIRRARLAPDDVVLKLHACYMDGESITALSIKAGIGRTTLWKRFNDLGLEQRKYDVPRPCSACKRKMVLNGHGTCRTCAREAARYRCPRCGIVVPVELKKGDVCDMCKDDAARRAERWRPMV